MKEITGLNMAKCNHRFCFSLQFEIFISFSLHARLSSSDGIMNWSSAVWIFICETLIRFLPWCCPMALARFFFNYHVTDLTFGRGGYVALMLLCGLTVKSHGVDSFCVCLRNSPSVMNWCRLKNFSNLEPSINPILCAIVFNGKNRPKKVCLDKWQSI